MATLSLTRPTSNCCRAPFEVFAKDSEVEDGPTVSRGGYILRRQSG
jgi:hypothetical protein